VAALALAGCAGRSPSGGGPDSTAGADEQSTGRAGSTTAGAPPSTPAVGDADPGVAYTFGRPNGNRLVGGRGRLPSVDPVDVPLDAEPVWLAGIADPPAGGRRSLWAAVLADGTVVGVRLGGADVERVDVAVPDRAATAGRNAVGPPAFAPDPPRLLGVEGGSTLTHPVRVGDALVGVAETGTVLVADLDGRVRRRHGIDALPDARPVTDGRVAAVLSGATDRYGHGVLGDGTEASRVTLLRPADVDAAPTHRETPGETVVEGIAPILWGGEALVTLSDADAGARLALLTADGPVSGPAIGAGFRWRHQLAVAPFGPDGGLEAAAVKTPHIGGVAEFYRHRGDRLELVATLSGYSTHAIGSRNLDTALAGDLDGDGRTELLVPTDAGDGLAGLRRTEDGATEGWRVDLPSPPATNLAGVAVDGATAVGVGLPDRLRFWPGEA
jgi:hypothetical protein